MHESELQSRPLARHCTAIVHVYFNSKDLSVCQRFAEVKGPSLEMIRHRLLAVCLS